MNAFGSDLKGVCVELPRSNLQLSSTLAPLRILVMLFIAIPLLAYLVTGAYRYHKMHAESEFHLKQALTIAQEHALKILQTNEILLDRVEDAVNGAVANAKDVNHDAVLRNQEKALHEQLSVLSLNKAQSQSIWVWDAGGRPLVSDRIFPVPANLNISDRDYFKAHQRKSSGLYLSERGIERATGTPFFDMTRGRYKAGGSFAGVASVCLSPKYFEDFHKLLVAEEPGMGITMVREDGAILTRWPLLAPNQPARLADDNPFMHGIRAGQHSGNMRGILSIDNRERLISYSKVGDYPIYIATSMAVAEIIQRWLIEMGWLAALGFPPMLGLYLAARLALSRTREALSTAEQLKDETINRKQVEHTLLQAQKMEALGRLTGAVAHDFNNVLMVMSTNLYLFKRKNPEVDDKEIDAVSRAVDTAMKLTRQLLAFSRRQPLMPERLDLQDWLSHMKDLLGPLLGRQVELSVCAQNGLSAIWVDSAELELALINLAINAKDAMPRGGRLSILARSAGAYLPPDLQTDMVMVEVSDTGTGIAPEILGKVFEPFFTTKPVGEGTGLGLNQVYGLCQRAGGRATVQSHVGVGTTFRLFFPAFDGKVGSPAKASQPELPSLAMDVLLVEDNSELAQALIPVLEALGCKVKHFDRGTAAKDWLAVQATLPDILLSDVVMPGAIDGLGLAKYVRGKYPCMPIILMSGYAEQLEAITQLGFEIIPKPCSPELLAETMERVTLTE